MRFGFAKGQFHIGTHEWGVIPVTEGRQQEHIVQLPPQAAFGAVQVGCLLGPQGHFRFAGAPEGREGEAMADRVLQGMEECCGAHR